MSFDKIGGKINTNVIYIGSERYERLSKCSIDLSFHSGRQITTARFLQFLIDNYKEVAKSDLLKELKTKGD